MRRALIVGVALAALALGLASSSALADSDPPSDVLLLQDVYLPYKDPPPPGVANPLRDLLKKTKAAGYPLKVAIVASTIDLGGVPQLFGKPQNYADFLSQEIAFGKPKPLLVVMPQGFGTSGAGPNAAAALNGLSVPSGANGDALGRAAIDAVVRLAKAAGHPVPKPKVAGGGSSGGGTSPAIIFGVPVALLALGGLLFAIKRRDVAGDEAQPEHSQS